MNLLSKSLWRFVGGKRLKVTRCLLICKTLRVSHERDGALNFAKKDSLYGESRLRHRFRRSLSVSQIERTRWFRSISFAATTSFSRKFSYLMRSTSCSWLMERLKNLTFFLQFTFRKTS